MSMPLQRYISRANHVGIQTREAFFFKLDT